MSQHHGTILLANIQDTLDKCMPILSATVKSHHQFRTFLKCFASIFTATHPTNGLIIIAVNLFMSAARVNRNMRLGGVHIVSFLHSHHFLLCSICTNIARRLAMLVNTRRAPLAAFSFIYSTDVEGAQSLCISFWRAIFFLDCFFLGASSSADGAETTCSFSLRMTSM